MRQSRCGRIFGGTIISPRGGDQGEPGGRTLFSRAGTIFRAGGAEREVEEIMTKSNCQWRAGQQPPVWRTLLPAGVWRQALLGSAPALRGKLSTQVCIIGAGATGLSVAYQLARAGKAVVLLDAMAADGIAGEEPPRHFGESLRTIAVLTQVVDAGYTAMIRYHGFKGAQWVAESHGWAIDWMEETIAREAIECDFARVDACLFLPWGKPRAPMERELHSAHIAGLRGAQWSDDVPIPGMDVGPGIRYPGQARVSPVPYLVGLRAAVEQQGGQVFGGTRVVALGSEAGLHRVETAHGAAVLAEDVVIATHVPLNDRFAVHSKQVARRTHFFAAAIPRGCVPDLLFREFGAPGHWARIVPGGAGQPDLLLVGGEDHKVGFEGRVQEEESRLRRLQWWARERFPLMKEVVASWSGQTLVTADGIAYIGRKPYDREGIYLAAGDNGRGLTYGAIAGRLLSELILQRKARWETLYDPARFDRVFTNAGLAHRLRDIAEVALCYGDYLRGSLDGEALKAIAPGEGSRLEDGGRQLACYRDGEGKLHCFSAVCPHLKGLVRWNAAEKTWDCPCHGSRFDAADGSVVNGPATEGLAAAELPSEKSDNGMQSSVQEKVRKIAGKFVKGIQQSLSARHRE